MTGVRLLAEDPDLASGLDAEETAAAERNLVVPVASVGPGPVVTGDLQDSDAVRGEVLAAVILDGAVAVDLHVGRQRCTQLLGAGDLLPVGTPLLPVPAELTVHVAQRARLALLDDRFLAAARRWPALHRQLLRRFTRLQQEGLLHQAIAQLPQVEHRLLGAFWCLADRWGSVGTDGVTVDLAITHEALGGYVGARRPTVSLGLKALADADLLTREARDQWRLSFASLAAVQAGGPVTEQAPRVQIPERRRVTARERAALRARLDRLRVANAEHRERSTAAIASSRSTRAEIGRRRSAAIRD